MRCARFIGKDEIEWRVRDAIRDIGYEQQGFHWRDSEIRIHLHAQSADIAQGVDASGAKDEGAGDQGLMFGYACRETPVLMPAPIHFSHQILKRMAEARHGGSAPGLGPDSKSQVTLRYVDGKPVAATSVVVSTQHEASLGQDGGFASSSAPSSRRCCRTDGCVRRRSSTSTRPAGSSSADRTATAA